jgi:hypothetical protein
MMTTQKELAQERKIGRLKAEIQRLHLDLSNKNRQLDAMHWAWCSGGCPTGMHKWTASVLTDDMIKVAEMGVKRMREWHHNAEFRARWKQMSPAEQHEWFVNNTQKKGA